MADGGSRIRGLRGRLLLHLGHGVYVYGEGAVPASVVRQGDGQGQRGEGKRTGSAPKGPWTSPLRGSQLTETISLREASRVRGGVEGQNKQGDTSGQRGRLLCREVGALLISTTILRSRGDGRRQLVRGRKPEVFSPFPAGRDGHPSWMQGRLAPGLHLELPRRCAGRCSGRDATSEIPRI